MTNLHKKELNLSLSKLNKKEKMNTIMLKKYKDNLLISSERNRNSTLSTNEQRQSSYINQNSNFNINNVTLPSIKNIKLSKRTIQINPIFHDKINSIDQSIIKPKDILIPFTYMNTKPNHCGNNNTSLPKSEKSYLLKKPRKIITDLLILNEDFNPKLKKTSQTFRRIIKHVSTKKVKLKNHTKPGKYNDELYDKVNSLDFQYDKLHKRIRESLLNDINPMYSLEAVSDSFYHKLENKINYIEDIYLVPHLRNHFILTGKNMEQKILKANCISKQICFSMNKEKRKKIFFEDQKRKHNFYNLIIRTVKTVAKSHAKGMDTLQIEEYFTKRDIYKPVNFASEKVKNICYSSKFTKVHK